MTSQAFQATYDYLAAVESAQARWMKILPAGKFRLRDGRGGDLDTGDAKSMQSIIDATMAYFGGVDLMVDYDHQLPKAVKAGGRAEAAGWIKELEVRQDGIYGRVEWTPAASAKIEAKEYRYISPWFLAAKNGHVLRLLNVGLVNMPALDLIAANTEITEMTETSLEVRLSTLLGLADGADEAAIVMAVEALTHKSETASAEPDPAQFVPMHLFQEAIAEANTLRAGVSEAEAGRLVAAAISTGAMIPALEEWAVSLCRKNVPAFQEFLASTGPAVMSLFNTRQGRGGGSLPHRSDEVLTQMEQAIAAALDLSEADYAAAKLSVASSGNSEL